MHLSPFEGWKLKAAWLPRKGKVVQKISVGRYVPAGKPGEERENLRWAFDSALTFLQTVGSLSDHIEVVKVDWIYEDMEGIPLEAVFLIVVSHPALRHKGEISCQITPGNRDVDATARSMRMAARATLAIATGDVVEKGASLDQVVRAIPFEAA